MSIETTHAYQVAGGPRAPIQTHAPLLPARPGLPAEGQPVGPEAPSEANTRGQLLRVLVCERLRIMREAICGFIRDENAMELAGATDSGIEAMSLIRSTRPHIVVTGMDLVGLSGLDLIHRLRQEDIRPGPRIIVFALGAEDEVLTKIIHADVSGVLSKEATSGEVVAAISAAAAGHTTLAPQLTQRLVEWFRQHNGNFEERLRTAADDLTEREKEVLQLIAYGRTMAQVAKELCIELTTVRTHVYRMRNKLDITDRAQLVSFAYRAGLMQRT